MARVQCSQGKKLPQKGKLYDKNFKDSKGRKQEGLNVCLTWTKVWH